MENLESDQWGLTTTTRIRAQAREDAGDQATIGFISACDWFWAGTSILDQSQSEVN